MKRTRRGVIFCIALFVGSVAFAQVTLMTEDFEAGSPPIGWFTSNNVQSVGFEFGTDLGSQYFPIAPHTRYAASNDDAHDDVSALLNLADLDYLITPPLDLTPWAADGVKVSFSYVQPSTYGSVGTVEVWLGGGAWIVVATVPPTTDWAEFEVDLSAFTVSNFVQIGFHHDDNGAWADGFAIDDVVVSTLATTDGAMEEVLTRGYLPIGPVNLEGVISNQGGATINSFEVVFQFVGHPVGAVGTISGLNLAPGDTHAFVHPVGANLTEVGTHEVDMWITEVNGAPDANPANDFASAEIITLSRVPPKKAILSNHTGAWCGYCPDGYVRLEQALALYGNLIGLSIHNGDAMAFPDGEELNATYISGYPYGLIDIYRFPDESAVEVSRVDWNARVAERLTHNVPVAVSLTDVSFEPTTREIVATVRADFFGQAPGDLRFNLWVVEDGVTGSGSGYNQTNYYNADPTHPYYGAGDPIVGFVHDRTLRAMLGGTWGTAGIIPPTVADGDVYSYEYSYILPAGSDETRVKLIGLVSAFDAGDIENRAILNAVERSLWGIFDDGFEWGDVGAWTLTSP